MYDTVQKLISVMIGIIPGMMRKLMYSVWYKSMKSGLQSWWKLRP